MAKKKSKTFSTQGFVSTEDKKRKQMTVHIGKSEQHGISVETQLYAKSIAGVHDVKGKYSTKRTKGENTRFASKRIDPTSF